MKKIISKECCGDNFTLSIDVYTIGNDVLFTVFNENEHLGGMGVGSYDEKSKRAYSSVISYPGHRDDMLAKYIAQQAAKKWKQNTCAIVGIHIPDIDPQTIKKIVIRVQEEIDSLLDEINRGINKSGDH
jgi:hypothetical protein